MEINKSEFIIDEKFADYKIESVGLKNAEFIGSNTRSIFIQFNSGSTYIYSNVDQNTIDDLYKAESISRFINIRLRNFSTQRLYKKVIQEKP